MKIASWNVNGIRAAERKGLSSIIQDLNPDIFCVQETTCGTLKVPTTSDAILPTGFVNTGQNYPQVNSLETPHDLDHAHRPEQPALAALGAAHQAVGPEQTRRATVRSRHGPQASIVGPTRGTPLLTLQPMFSTSNRSTYWGTTWMCRKGVRLIGIVVMGRS